MRTIVREQTEASRCVTESDEIFAQQAHAQRRSLRFDFLAENRRS
jgi:hypothetical protein